ncbi:hypothetical protein C8R46DRAFT_1038007 [Mycena filopes]|nr:hypothetical protein C8R46DRAFT_1038007 [Mycena filopes]
MPALIDGHNIATFRTVSDFFENIRVQAGRVVHPFTRRLNIHALTVDAAAHFLVPLLMELDVHTPSDLEPALTLSEGIVSCSYIRSAASFFKVGHSIVTGITPQGSHVSFGPGPERAVHRRAIALATQDHHLWQQAPNSQYMVPKFTPGDVAIPSRNALFKAHGTLLAIHCATLACGPHPVSIWLLIALSMGPRAMLLLKNYLAALDPVAFNCLAPWFMFGPADDLPTHFLHPFNQFLMNVMDIQPSMIESPRTPEVHDSWTILFVTKVLFKLNDTDIWKRPEFASVKRGFDVAFGNTTFIAELTKHPQILPLLDTRQTPGEGSVPRSSRSFELGLWGSIAKSPSEFALLSSLGAPVWWELGVSTCDGLDSNKETALTSLRIETRVWEDVVPAAALHRDVHKGRLVHNKPLEYYPPAVTDPSKYESAARGYFYRADTVHRDAGSFKDVLEMVKNTSSSGENRTHFVVLAAEIRAAGSLAGDLVEKYAADRAIAPTADAFVPADTRSKRKGERSKWSRQFEDMKKHSDAVPWAPRLIDSWKLASHNNDYYPLIHNIQLEPKCKDLLLYVLPPPHLFVGIQSATKLQTYFFIWICIRRPWLSRIHRASDDPAVWGFTTQTWRDILSGHYWKLCHPKDCETGFDTRKFWKFGGPLIFEDDDIGSFEPDISPHLQGSKSGRLEPVHFLNDGVKALILWDLALCHSQLQLDRADEVLSAALIQDAEARSIRRARRADIFFSPGWNWNSEGLAMRRENGVVPGQETL